MRFPPGPPSTKYRPDIDGLRAIAVGAVVLHHAGVGPFTGGFVGVDIFFVISGFLITSIIAEELEHGHFSIRRFYERRVRRIFPALFTVLFATTIAAAFLLLPLDFKEFGQSVASVCVFGSNVFFYMKAGYFDTTSQLKPLLHTWSLAVEEQYYLVFPLLLMLVWRLQRVWRTAVLTAVFLASLAWSIVAVQADAAGAFYLLWSRAWELLAGAALALGMVPVPQSAGMRHGVAWAGLLAIGWSIMGYSPETPFPGASALLPVLGAAALLLTGDGGRTVPARLLGARVPVFLGLISYSLYLWHWPLLVLARYARGGHLSAMEAAAFCAASVVLAALSWRWIERPFRISGVVERRPLAAAAAACILAGLGIGIAAHAGRGLPQRLPQEVAAIGMAAMDVNPQRTACDSRSRKRIEADDVCRIGGSEVAPTFLLLGDSFADALAPGVDAMAKDTGSAGYVLTRGGCPPLLSVNEDKTGACREFVDAALSFIRRHPEIGTVILIGRWTTVAEGRRFGVNRQSGMFVTDDASGQPGYEENRRVLQRGLERLLDALSGRRVVITAFIPEQPMMVPMHLALARYFHRDDDGGIARADYDERQRFTRSVLLPTASRHGAIVLDAGALLCDAARCRIRDGDQPLYLDDNHVTRSAAIAYRRLFAPAFEPGVRALVSAERYTNPSSTCTSTSAPGAVLPC